MKLSKRQRDSIFATLIFTGLIFLLLSLDIGLAFGAGAGAEDFTLGMVDGFMVAYLVFMYYSVMKSIDSGPIEKDNLPYKVQEKLVRKAIYIARTNNQDVDLEGFPVIFFKRKGITEVTVRTGCNIFSTAPDINFELMKRIEVGSVKVDVTSRELPIELAPDWLKTDPKYRSGVRKKINEIEEEMRKECKKGALDRLRKAVV